MLKRVANKVLPRGSRRFIAAKNTAAVLHLAKPFQYDPDYDRWMKWVEPELFLPTIESDKQTVSFSIVIPFYNTADKYLGPLIDSILAQSYQNWELIMADASTDDERADAIKEMAQKDSRLKYYRLESNGGISANTNEGLKNAKGDYIVFCDHDDTLDPHALNEAAVAIGRNDKIDVLYSDEDKLSDNGKWRHSPYFKPEWSPHLFLNTNYTNHLSIIKRELAEGVGGLRSECDGSQDYDFLLRVHRKYGPLTVHHIDKILYHWREAAGSTAVNHNSKSYAFEAGRKALQEYVDSGPVKGVVTNIPQRPGFYNHKYTPSKTKSVTVCIQLGKDSSTNDKFLRIIKDRTDGRLLDVSYVTSTAAVSLDDLVKKYITDAVFVIRESVLPYERDWLERLCGALELDSIATIAPRILNADMGIVYDMGIMIDHDGNEVALYKGLAANDQTVSGHVEWVADVEKLSGAVEGRLRKQHNSKKEKAYKVVWSYVNFRHVTVVADTHILSPHVYVNRKGKVKVNGKI